MCRFSLIIIDECLLFGWWAGLVECRETVQCTAGVSDVRRIADLLLRNIGILKVGDGIFHFSAVYVSLIHRSQAISLWWAQCVLVVAAVIARTEIQDSHWPGKSWNWFGQGKSGNFAGVHRKFYISSEFSAVALWLLHFNHSLIVACFGKFTVLYVKYIVE